MKVTKGTILLHLKKTKKFCMNNILLWTLWTWKTLIFLFSFFQKFYSSFIAWLPTVLRWLILNVSHETYYSVYGNSGWGSGSIYLEEEERSTELLLSFEALSTFFL